MLFPNSGIDSFNEIDRSVLTQMESRYTEGITLNQAWWDAAQIDSMYAIGSQEAWGNDRGGSAPLNRGNQFTFNRIRPILNMISGHQRRTRKSTTVIPVENANQKTADQLSKVMSWLTRKSNVLEAVSDAFEGALVTGMNLIQVWIDYRSDPVSGDIKVEVVPFSAFIVDPFFKKKDLSDCQYIWRRTYLSKREVISLMPDRAEAIMSLTTGQNGTSRDGKFMYMPENWNAYTATNLLAYDEYYYRTFRNQIMLIDSETGETLEWRDQDKKDALKMFLAQNPSIVSVEQEVPTVNLAIVCQGRVLFSGPNPLGIDDYCFVPVIAYYNPHLASYSDRIQGVVRGLRSAQFLFNRRMNIQLEILESQVNSGWIFKEDALVNPKDVYLVGQGKGIALKAEANMADVQKIQPAQMPPTVIEMTNALGKEIMTMSGVTEELMGSAVGDQAGVLAMLRQGAGLTSLQGLFDNLDQSQRQLYKIFIQLVQANMMPGTVARILEEEPTKEFYSKAFGRYDAAITGGLNTETQKQMEFAQLLELKKLGVIIPDDVLLDASTLQEKTKLIEAVKKQQEAMAQQQQQQQQVQMQVQQAEIELAKARTVADQGLGYERISRVEENKALAVERRAEARKDDNISLLNTVKALKELDTIDMNHIQQLFALQDTMRARSALDEEAEKVINQSAPQPEPQQPESPQPQQPRESQSQQQLQPQGA